MNYITVTDETLNLLRPAIEPEPDRDESYNSKEITMKTKQLSNYLADYINHEVEISLSGDISGDIIHCLNEIVQSGIEAFESINGCEVIIK